MAFEGWWILIASIGSFSVRVVMHDSGSISGIRHLKSGRVATSMLHLLGYDEVKIMRRADWTHSCGHVDPTPCTAVVRPLAHLDAVETFHIRQRNRL